MVALSNRLSLLLIQLNSMSPSSPGQAFSTDASSIIGVGGLIWLLLDIRLNHIGTAIGRRCVAEPKSWTAEKGTDLF
jgi:hypothetical protein